MSDDQSAGPAVPTPISVDAGFASVSFLADRAPDTVRSDYFATLADYRDGAIFIAHYAGSSEWERHPHDEIVCVVDGATTIVLLVDDEEHPRAMGRGGFIIVPPRVWHRFETPEAVKVLSVTPQPTDHQQAHPASPAVAG